MSAPSGSPPLPARRWLVIAAFAAIYLCWGSTFLAIRFAIETIPPFLMAGSRFLLAGLLVYGIARWRSREQLTIRQWRDAALVGCLLLAVGNGAVTYVEQTLPTTIAALLISLTPIWIVLTDWWRGGSRPSVFTHMGLGLGLAGVLLIVVPAGGGANDAGHLGGIVILLVATFSWAYGSVWSRQAARPASSFLAVGMQMIAAGIALLLVGVVRGEPATFDPWAVTRKSLMAWFYLFSAGSVIGYTAYIWLLRVTPPARVATHTYVNPVIAVILGIWVGNESLSAGAAFGGALIVMAVVLILRRPRGIARVMRDTPARLPGGPAATAEP